MYRLWGTNKKTKQSSAKHVLLNGLFCGYQPERSISNSVLLGLFVFFSNSLFVKSEDTDQAPHSLSSNLGQRVCLCLKKMMQDLYGPMPIVVS